MYEKMIGPFTKNLKFVMEENALSKKEMADKLFVSAAQYNKVSTGKQLPTLPLLLGFEKEFGYSLDQLLHVDLKEACKMTPEVKGFDTRYVGCFLVYYLDTNAYDKYYTDLDEKPMELKAGTMLVRKEVTKRKLNASLLIGMSRECAESYFDRIKIYGKSMDNMYNFMMSVSKNYDVFEGFVHFTEKFVQLVLTEQDSGTKGLITLHRIGKGVSYESGLGTFSMSLEHPESSPCISHIGISHSCLSSSDESIAEYLEMQNKHPVDFSVINSEVEEIFKDSEFLKNEQDRKLVVSLGVNKLLKRVIQVKGYQPIGVTEVENNRWQRFAKEWKYGG